MEFNELKERVVFWALEKGLLENGTPLAQLEKTKEEIQEVEECLINLKKGNSTFTDSKGRHVDTYEALKSEIGDSLVTHIVLCELVNLDPLECLETAYNKIKNRTGVMVEGQFQKD